MYIKRNWLVLMFFVSFGSGEALAAETEIEEAWFSVHVLDYMPNYNQRDGFNRGADPESKRRMVIQFSG